MTVLLVGSGDSAETVPVENSGQTVPAAPLDASAKGAAMAIV